MIEKSYTKIEKYFFCIVVLSNLIPVFSGKFFPTMDGAAHLYNAKIISSLFWGGSETLHSFFVLNHEPVPNWIGHFFFSALNPLLPAFLVEKILVLFYLIAFPYSFRNLVLNLNPNNALFSYLVIPFAYSFPFFMGFYNFSISLIFLFITLNFWIAHDGELITYKKKMLLMLLLLVTYFSHIFVFGILLFTMGLYSLVKTIQDGIYAKEKWQKSILKSIKKTGGLFLYAIIPLAFFIYYIFSRRQDAGNIYLSSTELKEWLQNIRPIIALSFTEEEAYTKKLFYLLFSLLVICLYNRINTIHNTYTIAAIKDWFRISDVWLLLSVLLLVSYFILPDTHSNAGYISVRLGLIFFLFLILWIATQSLPKWLGIASIIVVLICNFQLNTYYQYAVGLMNKTIADCISTAAYIKPNTIVLPLNYYDNWLTGHFSNYLGIDKPMVILQNYECSTGYFPVKWNSAVLPNTIFGNLHTNQLPCLQWESNLDNKKVRIDYVFILGNIDAHKDSCTEMIKQNLLDHYSLTYSNESCKLYHLKY